MSTLAMVEQVMHQTKTPMSVRDIVEVAGDALPTRSKTPETVVARDLSVNIKKLGDASRFVRTAPGRYTLREFVTSGLVEMSMIPTPAILSSDAIPLLESALKLGPSGVLPASPISSDVGQHSELSDVFLGRR